MIGAVLAGTQVRALGPYAMQSMKGLTMEKFETPQEAYNWFLNEIDELDDYTLITGLLTGTINHPIMIAATLDLLMERAAGDRMCAEIQAWIDSQD